MAQPENSWPRIHVKLWLNLRSLIRGPSYRGRLTSGISVIMADLWCDMTEEEHEAIREQIGFEWERK